MEEGGSGKLVEGGGGGIEPGGGGGMPPGGGGKCEGGKLDGGGKCEGGGSDMDSLLLGDLGDWRPGLIIESGGGGGRKLSLAAPKLPRVKILRTRDFSTNLYL